jgi:hypothetical protein
MVPKNAEIKSIGTEKERFNMGIPQINGKEAQHG